MSDAIVAMREKFNQVVQELQHRVCYTYAVELQNASLLCLEQLMTELDDIRKKEADRGDCEAANAALAYLSMCRALSCELRMWLHLKENEFDEAWDSLINAQSATKLAARAHEVASHMEPHLHRLLAVEKILFPPQMFVSCGMRVKELRCSLCGDFAGECDHLQGRIYCGEVCRFSVSGVEPHHVAIVDEPADKRCRMYGVAGKNIMTGLDDEKAQGSSGNSYGAILRTS